MYTKQSKEQQFSFSHHWFIVPELDQNHYLIKIAKTINWLSISNKLSKFYSSNTGRPTKPSRAKVGLLILKHLYRLSDEKVTDLLKRDIYTQYLCDISLKEAKKFINPSTLSKFRKQIGKEGINLIEQEILSSLKKAKLLKGKKLITDTTVVPVNIAYPTDVCLLEKTRRTALKLLETAKLFTAKTYRTYKRTAKKVFLSYQKIRHHTTKTRKKTQKKLIQFTKRNINQLKDAIQNISKTTSLTTDKLKTQFLNKAHNFIHTASNIISQQTRIYKGEPVKERIVSLHQPHIRPIVRGKYPTTVEFGPKILLNLKNRFLFLEDLNFNNIADSHLLETSIQAYKKRFKHLPTELSADRGFWSPKNQKIAESYGIRKIAIQNKGKNNHLKDKPFAKRLRRQRCAIEADISLAKRKFGLDRCLYYLPDGEEIWIRLCLIAMNLKLAVDYG